MQVSELLVAVRSNLTAMERAKKLYEDRLAPEYNLFDFIEPDEARLSQIIAWLIDPYGSHGQGERFLKLLIQKIDSDWPLEACSVARVSTEFSIPEMKDYNRGKIDILAQFGNYVLAIENKAGAGDQQKQVSKYLNYLASRPVANYRLIYLTDNGYEPSDNSISECERVAAIESGRLLLWSYREHIQEWLRECRIECRADRISSFIDEFSRYIPKRFEGVTDMTAQDHLIDLVTQSEAVAATMQVINAADAIRTKLLNKLRDDVMKRLPSQWKILSWNVNQYSRFTGLSIDLSEIYPVVFQLQFDNTQLRDLAFGVTKRVQGSPDGDGGARAALIEKIGPAQGSENELWPWWNDASEHDDFCRVEKNWNTSTNPWKAIADGTLANRIIMTADKFSKALAS